MPIIDPFDEVEAEKNPDPIRMRILYQKILYIFKIIIILISLSIIFFLILLMFVPEKGIVIQPFESTEKNLSSVFTVDHLIFELQDIKEINDKKIGSSTFQSYYGRIPSTLLGANSLEYSIAEIGDVGVGGTSLPLGQFVLSVKQLTGHRAPTLTGCVQRSGSDLHIIAILNDPDIPGGIAAWEIRKNLTKDCHTTDAVDDLAFQIATDLINENKKINSGENPQTWEAFKNLTQSRKAYYSYNATGDIKELNIARDLALKAKESEPGYSGMSILFSIFGSSYLKLNEFEEAKQLFKNAIELNSSYVDPWNGIGIALYDQGKYNDSIEAYNKAIELDPNDANVWYNKGLTFEKMKNYYEAFQAYNNSTNLNPKDDDAWYNKGNALNNLNMSYEAIKAFDMVTNLTPKDADAWNNKGIAYYALGDYKEAIKAYEKAIELNPKDPDFWNNKGIAYNASGEYNKAIQTYDKAIQLEPDYAEFWNEKGKALNSQAKQIEAIKAFDEATRLEPNLAKAWYGKGVTLKALGRNTDGDAALAKAKELGYPPS